MAVVRTVRPVWQKQLCQPCGACTHRCPASVFLEQTKEPDSLRGLVARAVEFPPGPRPSVPPCQAACPLGQEVPEYIKACSLGDFDRAREIVARTNPMAGSLSRLCVHGCELACVRSGLERATPIRRLKCAAVDFGKRPAPWSPRRERGISVAVVGGGPAGLAAAAALRRAGFTVKVFEAQNVAGGLLRVVPEGDLPRQVLEEDLAFITSSGVEIILGQKIDSFPKIQALFQEGFRAVILAVGARKSLSPFAASLEGCMDVISFCLQPPRKLNGPALVEGEDHPSLGAARLAAAAGARPVYLVTARPLQELALDQSSLAEAEKEGVSFLPGYRVVEATGKNSLEEVICSKVEFTEPDHVGRRLLLSECHSEKIKIPARLLVAGSERVPELDWLPQETFRRGPLGLLEADSVGRSTFAGVYLAGEALFGPRHLVGAVACGVRVAATVAGDLVRE